MKLLSKELGDLNKELDKLQAVQEAYKYLDDYKALVVEKEWLQQALEGDQAALTPEIERLREEIALADKAIGILKEQKAMLGMYEQAQLRLNELERQEKALAAEFERLEHELYLIEMYIKTKRSYSQQDQQQVRLASSGSSRPGSAAASTRSAKPLIKESLRQPQFRWEGAGGPGRIRPCRSTISSAPVWIDNRVHRGPQGGLSSYQSDC